MTSTSRMALVVILLCGAGPVARAAEDPKALFEAGKKKFSEGDFGAAGALFHRAYEMEKNPSYIYSEGSAYRRLGENDKAVIAYEEYLRLVPVGERPDERPKAVGYAAELRLQMGIRLKESGKCADAIREFVASLAHVPAAGAPWVYLGLCHEDVGNPEGARGAYEKALAIKDVDPALRTAAEARLAALRPPAALDPPATAPAAPKRPWGLIAGVAGGVAAAAVVTVVLVLVLGRPAPLDLGSPGLGVMTQEGW